MRLKRKIVLNKRYHWPAKHTRLELSYMTQLSYVAIGILNYLFPCGPLTFTAYKLLADKPETDPNYVAIALEELKIAGYIEEESNV